MLYLILIAIIVFNSCIFSRDVVVVYEDDGVIVVVVVDGVVGDSGVDDGRGPCNISDQERMLPFVMQIDTQRAVVDVGVIVFVVDAIILLKVPKYWVLLIINRHGT